MSGATVPPEWYADALCAQTDPEAFFPEKGGSTAAAKRVCAACPALDLCREYAVARPELEGIWGGLSNKERRRARQADTPATCSNGQLSHSSAVLDTTPERRPTWTTSTAA